MEIINTGSQIIRSWVIVLCPNTLLMKLEKKGTSLPKRLSLVSISGSKLPHAADATMIAMLVVSGSIPIVFATAMVAKEEEIPNAK